MNKTEKWIATAVAGALCGYLMYWTHGDHGIGWFIIALLVIW